jgi:PAS domain S-box-containing protein
MLNNARHKILLIEDDEVDQIAFKRMVKREKLEYTFEIAESLAAAKRCLLNNSYDLVITDYQLGDGNALSLFEYLKSTPFIFATGGGDEEVAVNALKAGAFDYLIKDQARNYLKVLPLTIQNALRRSKINERLRLLESVIVHANDAVVIASADTFTPEIMYVNRAFVEMSGYSEPDVAGKTFGIFVGEETDRVEMQRIAQAFQQSEAVKSELVFYKKDGTPYWVGVSIVPLKDKNDKTTHFVSIQRDVTERKAAEQALIEAREAAEQARLAESQFLANMSHEIRTPMNAVIGMTHLLMDSKPSEKQLEYLKALKFSADSLMGIISDILDLSKIEAGKLDFEERQFNLYELLNSLHHTFEYRLKEKAVKIILRTEKSIKNDIIGDPTRLSQILTNLLGNSAKFTDKGHIGIELSVLEQQDAHYLLRFDVFDTGIGIDEGKLDLVFENFKQANAQIHRKFGGTGLGLPIVKNLVELQGGTIKVKSKLGVGTTFSFTLPVKDSGIESVTKTDMDDDVMGNQITDDLELLTSARILIAEDNLMNQKLIGEIMRKWQLNFDMVSDGVEALEKLSKQRYDLVLMDVNMPRLNGYDAARKLRADQKSLNQHVPIIALTAAALQSEREKVFASGMDKFVSKPFVPANLKKVMIELLQTPTATPQIPAPTNNTFIEKPNHKATAVTVDLSYLQEFSGGDSSFITEMIGLFLSEASSQADLLEQIATEKDWDRLSKLAHKMKPNFQMLGMEPQRELAFNLEIMSKSDTLNMEKLKTMSKQLAHDTRMAIPILEKELMAFA